LKGDPRFESNVKRSNHLDEVDELVEEWTIERERDDIEEILLDAGVPCGPVKELDEVADDPHLKEREMINEIEHPDYGEISVPGIPIRFSGSELPDIEPSPTKGRDTRKVMCERLGYSEAEYEELKEKGVF
jgi:CoA:oxalate CoA-transferase